MLLKKIVVKHVKKFLEPREQRLRRKMHNNRSQLLVAGRMAHVNARPHIADVVAKRKKTSRLWVGNVTSCAASTPDVSQPGFDLFPKIKEPMRGRRVSSQEVFSTEGTRAIRHINKSGVLGETICCPNFGTQSLRSRETTLKDCEQIISKK